jgi:hypothetical protein
MYGLVIDSLEKYVVSRCGEAFWDRILFQIEAPETFKRNMIVIHQNYPDELYMKLVAVASRELNMSSDALSEVMGYKFIESYAR